VITSEELRVAALDASAKRGKWVAQRRIARRWLVWLMWTIVLPIIGVLTLIAALAGLAFWQYQGHDASYALAQKWVQDEFGKFESLDKSFENVRSSNTSNPVSNPSSTMVLQIDGEMPSLKIDRSLTLKLPPNKAQ
jgi:hypothetical protein